MAERTTKRILCLLLAVFAVVSMFSISAFADEADTEDETEEEAVYYLSYKKYVEAENPDGSIQITYNMVTDQIANLLAEGMRRYEAGVAYEGDDGYYKPFTNSYGFWYETSGFEKTVMGYISGARVNEVELQFSTMKKAVNNGESVEQVQAEVDTLIALLREDADYLDDLFGYTKDSGNGGLAWATFGAVFSIIIREGLEAILIVGAIVAYLVKTENKRGTKYVYAGAIIAVLASFGLAALLYSVTQSTSNSIPQEYTEGIAALIAVAVLIYVSNWMISKAESSQWTNYISGKVAVSASNGKMIALAFTAFLAVFREGAEIILFCQQYFSRAGSMNNGYLAVFGGIAGGIIVVLIVFFAIRIFGVKLPLKPFFLATSILMAVMSVAFIGSGMWELFLDGGLAEKIGGFILNLATTIQPLSWMSGNDVLAFFGIYPTWLTLGPQIILLAVNVVTFVVWLRKNSKEDPKPAKA